MKKKAVRTLEPFPNKFPGRCKTCNKYIQQGEGFLKKGMHKWETYCKEHKPPRLSTFPDGVRDINFVKQPTSKHRWYS